MAWIRTAGKVEELVVASDSRLRPFAWDAAPKIVVLPRNDAVVAFAGDTDFAYPIMLQMANTVASWDKAANRAQPLEEAKGHLLRVLNCMFGEFTDLRGLGQDTSAIFLLAGFSWKSQKFVIWTLHFDPSIGRFTFRPATRWRGGNSAKLLAVVGDEVDDAKEQLTALLRERRRLTTGGFDMEPLEVLTAMIDSPKYVTIGGYVQLIKVYRSLRVVPFVIERGGIRSLFGRPLLDYEEPDRFPTLAWPPANAAPTPIL
jgi:hypothetical protein